MPDQANPDDLRPFGPRVLLADPPEPDEKKLILPESAAPDMAQGIVIEIGDDPLSDFRGENSALKKGDLVYYPPGCATEIDGQKIVGIECIRAYRRFDSDGHGAELV